MLEMSWIHVTAILQLYSQVTDLFGNVIVKRINIRLFDLLALFHYILNLPRILTEQNARKETKKNAKVETKYKNTKRERKKNDKTGFKAKKSLKFEDLPSTSGASPRPCTSGLSKAAAMEGVPVSEEDESDVDDEINNGVSCCMCKQARPPEFDYLVITQWANCDTCMHWTHLKFCSTVRVIRNDTFFE